jgi:cell division protein FtsW (lipid II flippase)
VIARTRRRTELGLIVLGSLIIAATYVLAALGRTATLPVNIAPFLGAVLGLLLLAHLATRRYAPGADGLLLPLAALLNGIGYVFIARLDEASRDPDGLAALQAVWTAMGIAAFVATLVVVRRARDLRSYKYLAMVAGVGLLMLPLAPIIGRSINGARIWVEIGPVGFQPGEFAKIALAVFFAGYLADNRELLGLSALHPKYLGPVIVAWGASLMVMFFQKDLGSSLLFFALFVVLLWVATGRGIYLLLGLAMFAGGATLAHSRFAHVQDRVDTWLNPWPEYRFAGNQVLESWFALADGGVTGTGLGLGSPQRIPVVETDFIFAAIGEELGLFGAAAVLIAYVLMIGLGLRIAIAAEDPFEKLLATGLTTLLGLQAFLIMAGVTRLLPLTGVTLPFVSYGGSSLLGNYILLALLIRISHDTAVRRGEVDAGLPGRQRGEAQPVAA